MMSAIEFGGGGLRSAAMAGSTSRWDPVSPPSLVVYFWVTELLLPYFYAAVAEPWRSAKGMMTIIAPPDIHLAMLAGCLYLACWFAGYWLTRGAPRFAFKIASPPPLSTTRCLLLFAGAVVLFFTAYQIMPREGLASRMDLTVGLFGRVLFITISVLFVAYWISSLNLLRANRGRSRRDGIVLLFFLTLCMVAVLLPLGGRGRALVALLYAAIMYHYFVKPLPTIVLWQILFAGAVGAVGIHYVEMAVVYGGVSPLELAYGLRYGRQFDTLLNTAVAMKSISMGYTQFHYGFAFIADVANDIGIKFDHLDSRQMFMLKTLRMPSFVAGFPVGRTGEFYMAFGWIGVAVGAFIIGSISKMLYIAAIVRKSFGSASVPIYATFLLDAGLVQQNSYMFSDLVISIFNPVLMIIIALIFYKYKLKSSNI